MDLCQTRSFRYSITTWFYRIRDLDGTLSEWPGAVGCRESGVALSDCAAVVEDSSSPVEEEAKEDQDRESRDDHDQNPDRSGSWESGVELLHRALASSTTPALIAGAYSRFGPLTSSATMTSRSWAENRGLQEVRVSQAPGRVFVTYTSVGRTTSVSCTAYV